MLVNNFTVNSSKVKYTDETITSEYEYSTTKVEKKNESIVVTPVTTNYTFQTKRKLPKTGAMIVGIGGNNGTTLVAGILANKLNLKWNSKEGPQSANYFGSITQASTVELGETASGEKIFVPLSKVLPMVEPNDLVITGWDISAMNLADAMGRAKVLNYDLQRQLVPHMKEMKPLPSIYFPDFIAANQADRADNVIEGKSKKELLEHIRQDIRKFKKDNDLDQVIVLWSANTERFAEVRPGLNMTADELMASIEKGEEEVSPSTIFAIASILEGSPYINGSPQNTFVPGVIQLAEQHNIPIGGDDFKSGQTKFKSVIVDFLVSSGIKPVSIVSYNHLGNNDGKNLSSQRQFRSKEISKSNVVDDMVESNQILYKKDEHPDHCVVIKYVPQVGDSKRAMDEYVSQIFLDGTNTVSMHNTCEDSLLATPLIIDLVLLTELMTRITYKTESMSEFDSFHPVLSILSFLLKAPLTPPGTPVVNALFKQRACIVNVLRACVGLPAANHMTLEHKAKSNSKVPSVSGAMH